MKKLSTISAALIFLLFPVFGNNTLFAEDASNKIGMLEIVISNLISRIETLEKRVSALEKKSPAQDSLKVAKDVSKDVSSKEHPKRTVTNGFEDIGGGFAAKNIRFQQFGSNVLLTGEIANSSDKNYRFIKFTLEIYDEHNLLIRKEEFTIPDLPKESVKTFDAMLVGLEAGLINKYAIKTAE